jgi:hypothetical protein
MKIRDVEDLYEFTVAFVEETCGRKENNKFDEHFLANCYNAKGYM